MPRQPDFISDLSRDQLDGLEAYAREPGRTVDDCVGWLVTNVGKTVNRTSVWRWKVKFDANDKIAAASRLAADIVSTAKTEGAAGIGEAATHTLSQLLFEQLLRLQTSEDVDSGELMKLSISLGNAMKTQGAINELKKAQRDAVAQAEAAAKAGKSGADVVSTIKQALGIAA